MALDYIQLRLKFIQYVVLGGQAIKIAATPSRMTFKNAKYFDENFVNMLKLTMRELKDHIQTALEQNNHKFEIHFHDVDIYFQKSGDKTTIAFYSRVA